MRKTPHIMFHGDHSVCSQVLPTAKHALYKALRKFGHLRVISVEGKAGGSRFVVKVYGTQSYIHIWAGEFVFSSRGDVVRENTSQLLSVFGRSLTKPFKPKQQYVALEYRGNNSTLSLVTDELPYENFEATYPVPGDDPVDISFSSLLRPYTIRDNLRIYPLAYPGHSFDVYAAFPRPRGTNYFPTTPKSRLIGLQEVENDQQVSRFFNTSLSNFGLTDHAGVEVGTPFYYTWYRDQASAVFLYPTTELPDDMVRYWNIPHVVAVAENTLYVVLVSQWTYTPNYDSEDGRATARVLYTQNGGDTWTVWNIRDIFFQGIQYEPHQDTEESLDPEELLGDFNNNLMATIFPTTSMVAMDNNEALLTYMYRRYENQEYVFYTRVILLHPQQSPSIMFDTIDETPFWFQSIVYLGNNKLMAKAVEGFDAVGLTTWFMLSTDRGQTWFAVSSVGLTPPGENQYYGNLKVTRTATAEQSARVALPAFDPADSAYYVFVTESDGATWQKQSLLATTEQFQRVDTMTSGDGGGNFDDLNYLGPKSNPAPVDLAVPIIGSGAP